MTQPMQAIDPADYALPESATDAEVVELLKQPLVRLCNLYWIKDADAKTVKFVPNRAQCCILWEYYINGTKRVAVPKARQLGISTLAALIALDETLFSTGRQASIIDQTAPHAASKLRIIKFAFERLPGALKDVTKEDNTSALGWVNDSIIYAGKSARGGTNQFLHISEWGVIAFDDPARSDEITTGALPSASGGSAKVLAESTHKGGKGGDWYNMVTRSLTTAPEHRTAEDFVVCFFPWYDEPRYTLEGDYNQVPNDYRTYFAKLEKEIGRTLTDGQKLWYFKKKESLGRKMYSEYPSTIEECWMAPNPGAIYAPNVDKARADGRINDTVLHFEGLPVYTAFDIGAAPNTKCWIFQSIGDRINFLEALTGGDDCDTPAAWAKRLKERPYSYGGHFLPHDGAVLWRQLLTDAGLKGVVAMPRVLDEWDNINDARSSFSRCHFNKTDAQPGVDALDAFRSKVESDGETIRDTPVHDWASHFSTAFGYVHQAIRLGMLVDRSAMPTKPRNGLQRPQSLTGLRTGHNVLKSGLRPRVLR